MIENVNASKNPSNGEFVDIRKYIGVASVNVLAINPNNEKLRSYGWSIPEDADEPKYVITKTDNFGNSVTNTRIRLLVQIQDLEDKPVISLDFWCRPEMSINKTGDKCEIIDAYGRTAWGTKEEITSKKIPTYSNGQAANISIPYKISHPGEKELVAFLFKYLNITPLQTYNRDKKVWENSKNPGRLTIDSWKDLCNGDVHELARYLSLQPNNRVKVVLGIRQTDDNKSYQTFLNTGYIGNGALPDRGTGEYTTARKLIDKYNEGHQNGNITFSASPVKEWSETASSVSDNTQTMFDEDGNFNSDLEDLPFDM